jgi:hypothetical protein
MIISLLFIIFSLFFITKTYKFNIKNVQNHISLLSSDAFSGRLGGSIEDIQTTSYIQTQFELLGIKPFNDNYIHSFKTKYPKKIDGKPYLRILSPQGKVVKEYTYGVGFKEDMINFKDNKATINQKSYTNFSDKGFIARGNNGTLLFFVPENNNLNFRSSFMYNSNVSMCIFLKDTTYDEIKKNFLIGYSIDCFIPYEVADTELYNVIGVIEGKDKTKSPLVIGAHFDHIGTDLNGTVYGGALDNASGVGFILELAKYLKSLPKPNQDIIIIAFDGEEYGCLGSKTFVEQNKDMLSSSKVFNFDMIGGSSDIPLYIMGNEGDNKSYPFMSLIDNICTKNKVSHELLFSNCSDHEFFRFNKIDALTLSDNDSSKIHTPDDKAEFINPTSIDRCFTIASSAILSCGYGKITSLFTMSGKIILILALAVFCTSTFTYYNLFVKSKNKLKHK